MIYDRVGDRVILTSSNTPSEQELVFAYNATSNAWNNITPLAGPQKTATSAGFWLERERRLVMFGGYRSNGTFYTNDLWAFDPDNGTWENRTPAVSPPPRRNGAFAYDSQSGLAVLWSGCTGHAPGFICNSWISDVWTYRYSTNTWTKKTDNSPAGAYSGMAHAYDPLTDRILTYGGWGGAEYSYFTWSYDVDSNTWKNMFPAKYPGKLSDLTMSFDDRSKRMVLFSGWDPTGPNSNDTWTYSPAENTWYKMAPPSWPLPRGPAPTVYDSLRDRTILFGGKNRTIAFNDTWAYELQNVPTEPRNATAADGHDNVNLSWAPPASDEGMPVTNYRVYRGTSPGSFAQIADIGNTTAYTDTAVGSGTRYYYRIAARTAFGQGEYSLIAQVFVTGTPHAPGNLNGTAGGLQVSLTWDAPANDGGSPVTGYRISRGESSGAYTQNFTVGNVTSYVDSAVVCGRTEYYVVSGINVFGDGARSQEASATPCPGAAPPRVLAIFPANGSAGVALDEVPAVTFSEDMEPISTAAALSVTPAVADATVEVSGATLSLRHSAPLMSNTTYLISVAATARSAVNLSLGQSFTSSFTTTSQKFAVRGTITDAQGGAVPGVPVVAFDNASGVPVASSVTASDGGYRLDLEGGRRYYLEITFPDLAVERTPAFDLESDIKVDYRSARYAPIPPGAFPWMLLVVGLVGTLSALAAIAYLGGEAVLFILILAPIILYSRIHREKVLDHFVRGQIYGHIKTNPGATFTEIAQVLGVSNGVLTYHLYTLERTEFIRSQREGRWKRFWPRDAPKTKGGVMVSKLQSRILELIRANPGISQVELAAKLGTKRQNVNYNVQKLVNSGLVKLDGWGFRKRCVALEPKDQAVVPVVEPDPADAVGTREEAAPKAGPPPEKPRKGAGEGSSTPQESQRAQ
jgi:DNA-binding MarR family transcriptional regulator